MKKMMKFFALATVMLAFTVATFAQGATATATATATIVTPLTLTKNVDMDFGKLAVTAIGTVILTPAGAVTPSAGITTQGGTVTAAAFTATGQAGQTFSVTLPSTATILSLAGQTDMTVDTWTTDATATNALGVAFHVGGTLHITTAAQGAGIYTSPTPFTVTVNYN